MMKTYVIKCALSHEPIIAGTDEEEAQELYDCADDPIYCEVWDEDKLVETWPVKSIPKQLN